MNNAKQDIVERLENTHHYGRPGAEECVQIATYIRRLRIEISEIIPETPSRATLEQDIRAAINRHSAENTSNTPDFILSQYLESCLAALDAAVQQRETSYGRDARPTEKAAP